MRRRSWLWIAGAIGVASLVAVLLWLRGREERVLAEARVAPLPLTGGPERADAELSGMSWRGSELVLLPQYPRRFGPDGGALFVVPRADNERAIDGGGGLAPRTVPLEAPGLEDALPGFDGYEAIAFAGDDVYVAIETRTHGDRTVGYLLRGRAIGQPLARVVIDVGARVELPAQTDLGNIGYEAIVVQGDRVYALYETNGEINPRPRVVVVDRALRPIAEQPMAPVEYRVTDATDVDEEGRFWVANYHWPGSPWQPGVCQLTERHGQGESHARCATVERLVELRVTARGIETTPRAPILFSLIDDAHARNWEGIVRLPGRGFLVVTDEHPSTMLAFVRWP